MKAPLSVLLTLVLLSLVLTGTGVAEVSSFPLPYDSCVGNYEVRLEPIPQAPEIGEPVTLHISGKSGDAAVPKLLTHEIQGNSVSVYAEEQTCSVCQQYACAQIVTGWAFDVQLDPLPAGTYTAQFALRCQSVTGECAAKTFTVTCYDFGGDGQVDAGDIQSVAARWRRPTQYETIYDLDKDGDIDLFDVLKVTTQWKQSCS